MHPHMGAGIWLKRVCSTCGLLSFVLIFSFTMIYMHIILYWIVLSISAFIVCTCQLNTSVKWHVTVLADSGFNMEDIL